MLLGSTPRCAQADWVTRRNLIKGISGMMINDDRRARLQWILPVTVYLLAASCAGNSSSPTMPDLVSGSQVCLALDWGSGSRPNFFGWTAPEEYRGAPTAER